MQVCISDAHRGESRDWPDRMGRGIRDPDEPGRGYRNREEETLTKQAEDRFANIMLTAPPQDMVILLCGSLGSTNGTVDPLSDRP